MALVTVRYWAGARRAAGRDGEDSDAATVGQLVETLKSRPGLDGVIGACSVLVDGQAATSDTVLAAGAVVDLLPPFAGG